MWRICEKSDISNKIKMENYNYVFLVSVVEKNDIFQPAKVLGRGQYASLLRQAKYEY